MSRIFEVDFRQGSLRDRVSGTIPTNTNVVISQQEKGRCAYFNGAASLNYGNLPDLAFIKTQPMSLVCPFRTGDGGTLIGKIKPSSPYTGWQFLIIGNDLNFYLYSSITGGDYQQVQYNYPINDTIWHLCCLTYDGSGVNGYAWYIDGNPVANNSVVDNLTGTLTTNDSVVIGSRGSALYYTGDLLSVKIYNEVISSAERTKTYQEFLASQHITKPIVITKDTNIARLEGTQTHALASVANYRSSDSAGSIECEFRSLGIGVILFGSSDEATSTKFCTLLISATQISWQQQNADTLDYLRTPVLAINDAKWHTVRITSDGSSYSCLVDGAPVALSVISGANSGDWFADTPNRDNVTIGALKRTTTQYYFQGELANVIVRDATGTIVNRWKLDESGGNIAYDSVGSTHLTWTGSGWNGVSGKNMIVSVDGTNWNADGGTTNRSFGKLEKGSGAFRCLEDATGKYIECTTNGTLMLKGIDLSVFTGNGYLKKVLGDLSGDAGGTVDAASAFAFSGDVLTITMTAGQTLRGFTITAGA